MKSVPMTTAKLETEKCFQIHLYKGESCFMLTVNTTPLLLDGQPLFILVHMMLFSIYTPWVFSSAQWLDIDRHYGN